MKLLVEEGRKKLCSQYSEILSFLSWYEDDFLGLTVHVITKELFDYVGVQLKPLNGSV